MRKGLYLVHSVFVLFQGILVFTFVNFEPLSYGDYALPPWAQVYKCYIIM